MKLVNCLLICALSSILVSCEYWDSRLTIINKTGRKIATETYTDTVPEYPSVNQREFYLRQAFAPDSSTTMLKEGKEGWPNYLESSKNSKLNLVIFDFEDVEQCKSIDSLITHKKYRIITMDKTELIKNNWQVVIK
ncbi:hypothetical protein [Hymenobacter perfusus]|uniref:Lipoprotein n=1 Tax=Hymenobacter perfusus TaxID=1236770 RepID=A0A428K157_9BACT|nr:hypothetical protein [Hymenobacter perfusus]RSK40125.1 hypothetical protein EI293_19335 [Hymenobacter perfusus]